MPRQVRAVVILRARDETELFARDTGPAPVPRWGYFGVFDDSLFTSGPGAGVAALEAPAALGASLAASAARLASSC
jgi:hypothetical protein